MNHRAYGPSSTEIHGGKHELAFQPEIDRRPSADMLKRTGPVGRFVCPRQSMTMAWCIGILLVLRIIYGAAALLTIRDRWASVPSSLEPESPRLALYPQSRVLLWLGMCVFVPLGLFALLMWFIVFLPHFPWRGVSIAAMRILGCLGCQPTNSGRGSLSLSGSHAEPSPRLDLGGNADLVSTD